jgi:hypothetical protein
VEHCLKGCLLLFKGDNSLGSAFSTRVLMKPSLIAGEEDKQQKKDRMPFERDLALEPVPSKKFKNHGCPTTSQEGDPMLEHREQKRTKPRHSHSSQSIQGNATLGHHPGG